MTLSDLYDVLHSALSKGLPETTNVVVIIDGDKYYLEDCFTPSVTDNDMALHAIDPDD